MARALRLIHIVGAFALGLALIDCGGPDGPVCGNGVVEPGEQCDNDGPFCENCIVMLPATTTIRWTLNRDPVPGFGEDGCLDLGISTIEVEILGQVIQSQIEQCSLRQVVFSDLPTGVYTARLRPLDSDGNLLVTEPVDQGFQVGGQSVDMTVNLPPEVWVGPYTGSYFFHLLWDGGVCADASPPVVEQRLVLEQDGVIVPLADADGNPLEGPCVDGTQSAVQVPFGFATLLVQGLDDGGVVQYEQFFETFVGAGPSNVDFELDLRTLMPDAGMPDAGMPDAGMPDAGMPDAGMPDAGI